MPQGRTGGLNVSLIVAFAISAASLWIAFRNVDVGGLGDTLASANYWWLLTYPVLGISLNLIRAEIWRLLLRRRVTRAEAFWAYSVGFLVNNVMPFRLGEGARIATLALRGSLPILEVGAAAGIERVLDLIAVGLILATTLPFVVRSADVEQAAIASGATVLIALAGLTVLIVARAPLERVVRRVVARLVPGWADTIVARWRELSESLAVVAQPAIAAHVALGAALVWMLTIVLQWIVLRAFQPLAQPIDAAVMVGIVSIASAVPAAPGSIGTYQWIGRAALAGAFPLRYTPTTALAIALVSHATSYIFSTLLGVGGLWYCGVSLAGLRGTARHAAAPLANRATNP